MNWRPENSTLVITSVVSAVSIPFVYYISNLILYALIINTGNSLQGSVDEAMSWGNMLIVAANILHTSAFLIGSVFLVCGALALYELYKRHKSGTVSKRLFAYPSILFGFSILLSLVWYVYLPLTASW